MENAQPVLSPAESITSYLISVRPTFNCSGGLKPVRFKGSFELSVGTGTCQETFAYDWPVIVGTSISGGHRRLGRWISVMETMESVIEFISVTYNFEKPGHCFSLAKVLIFCRFRFVCFISQADHQLILVDVNC